jgi:hypothetical protein
MQYHAAGVCGMYSESLEKHVFMGQLLLLLLRESYCTGEKLYAFKTISSLYEIE